MMQEHSPHRWRFLSWLFAAIVFGGVGGLLTYTYLEVKHPEVFAAPKKEGGEEKEAKEKGEKGKEEHTAASQAASKPSSEPAGKGEPEKKEEAKEPPDVRTLPSGDVAVRM